MPIHRVKGGWKWGEHGHVYSSRKGAERQAAAAHAHGYTGKAAMDLALHRARSVLRLAGLTLEEGQHVHVGSTAPHDIRVRHTGVDGDREDPFHNEESKAYQAVKKAEEQVRAAIRNLQDNRRTITASPQAQFGAQEKIRQARTLYGEAKSKLDEIANNRTSQLRELAETLALEGPSSSVGQQAARLGQGIRQNAGDVAGHYAGVMSGTSYAGKATVRKHGDHETSRFDPVREREEDGPRDASELEKHDTPRSPHSQHMTPSGEDPDEVWQHKQRTRPATWDEQPPEWLERENRRRARAGYNPNNEYPGVNPFKPSPLAASRRSALDTSVDRVRPLPRSLNNDGMFDGYEDENMKKDEPGHGASRFGQPRWDNDKPVKLPGPPKDLSGRPVNRSLRLARLIRRSLSPLAKALDSGVENFREKAELKDYGDLEPPITGDMKGVRDPGERTWPDPGELDNPYAEATGVDRWVRGKDPAKEASGNSTWATGDFRRIAKAGTEEHMHYSILARQIRKSLEKSLENKHKDRHGSTEHHHRGGSAAGSGGSGGSDGGAGITFDRALSAFQQSLYPSDNEDEGNETPIESYEDFSDEVRGISERMAEVDPDWDPDADTPLAEAMFAATMLGEEPTEEGMERALGPDWYEGINADQWEELFNPDD